LAPSRSIPPLPSLPMSLQLPLLLDDEDEAPMTLKGRFLFAALNISARPWVTRRYGESRPSFISDSGGHCGPRVVMVGLAIIFWRAALFCRPIAIVLCCKYVAASYLAACAKPCRTKIPIRPPRPH